MKNGVAEQGLKCVAVLIGSYSLQSGLPTLGVVFEPFSNKISESEKLVWVKSVNIIICLIIICLINLIIVILLVLFKYLKNKFIKWCDNKKTMFLYLF